MSMQSQRLKDTEIPLSQIKRPIPPVLDYQKIDAMVSTLKGVPMGSATCKVEDISSDELPPIDVFRIREEGNDFYFAFGGCHRFQAYDRISQTENRDVMVRCKILPATRKTLKLYLGSSVDQLFEEFDREKNNDTNNQK